MDDNRSDHLQHDVVSLVKGLRQDVLRGTLKLFKEHLSEDAVVVAEDDVRIVRGKESCLEYFRTLVQRARIRWLKGDVEDLKLVGDVAIVVETQTYQYEVKGEDYLNNGRATSVFTYQRGRWYLTHLHMDILTSHRVISDS
jgi:ketosteroid isomerase-like protein